MGLSELYGPGFTLCSFLSLHCLIIPLGKKGVLPFGLFYLVHFRFPSGSTWVEGVGGNLVWAWPGEGGSLGAPAP